MWQQIWAAWQPHKYFYHFFIVQFSVVPKKSESLESQVKTPQNTFSIHWAGLKTCHAVTSPQLLLAKILDKNPPSVRLITTSGHTFSFGSQCAPWWHCDVYTVNTDLMWRVLRHSVWFAHQGRQTNDVFQKFRSDQMTNSVEIQIVIARGT